jgi:mannobiose 2-epimerase
MKTAITISIIACIMCIAGSTDNKTYINIPINNIKTAMTNHIDLWYPNIIDTINGGFYTQFDYQWRKMENQPKMLVTQARGLWTAAKASQIIEDNQHLVIAANHGYNFITKNMWDTENGGFRLNFYDENEKYKLVYGNAFAIFALAEYAKINSSDEVYDWLNKSFEWLENNAYDTIYGGYFNLILTDEVKAELPKNIDEIMKFGWGHPSWKDQNTSIHLLEAFTALYQVMPTPKVKKRLEEMLILIRDTMTGSKGTLKLFFETDWTPINHVDSSRIYILKNSYLDHVSFGHDIETAYLLLDASQTLYGKIDKNTLEIAKKLCDHSLDNGFDENYFGIYNRGYYFNNSNTIEIIDPKKVWWAQFEGWHTLAIMASLFPDEPIYEIAFTNMWNYIETEITDTTHRGYFEYGIDQSPKATTAPKAHGWKSNYHDGRALMRVYEYANKTFDYTY